MGRIFELGRKGITFQNELRLVDEDTNAFNK